MLMIKRRAIVAIEVLRGRQIELVQCLQLTVKLQAETRLDHSQTTCKLLYSRPYLFLNDVFSDHAL